MLGSAKGSAYLINHGQFVGREMASGRPLLDVSLDFRKIEGGTFSAPSDFGIFKVKGDASEEQLEELVQVAQARSPVFDIVSNPVPVSVRMEK